jgi:N6-L-threonylcarbamoyladenine synthase
MRANLITGMDTAKGLAVAWQVPLMGVNHMQAHALTPRLVSALDVVDLKANEKRRHSPEFPFLTLLVSGGHTMLVHSKGLCDHEILANTTDIAVGDMIDKTARDILPANILKDAGGMLHGPLLERYAFPAGETDYGYTTEGTLDSLTWSISRPLRYPNASQVNTYKSLFSFSGIGSQVKRIATNNTSMACSERQLLARETMRAAFEHLASRITIALKTPHLFDLKTLVVSGGVASNQYLKYLLRNALNANGHREMELVFPPPMYCTDNAAMIAWAGMEMWDAGYRTDLSAMALRKWAIDSRAEDGGILGLDGWKRVEVDE